LKGWRFFCLYKDTEVSMNFQEGDAVMHWVYGLGKIIRKEERELFGKNVLYFAVQINDLTVWVPVDDQLDERLRVPTSESGFKKLAAILSTPGEPLPDDRNERRIILNDMLRDGQAESLCRVISSISTFKQKPHSLNDSDQAIMSRARKALLAEWGLALSITPGQAEDQLHRLLGAETQRV
jgi:RNA polymerase-interacting CarD/CdnL/TRCF family regulator